MRARSGLLLLALPLALLLPPAGSLADDAPDAAARLKALEERIESLEFDLDQVRKSSDDALFWLRLGDVAEIDKVNVAGPPNPRAKERYGISNERPPIRFAQYVFAPKAREAGRKSPVAAAVRGRRARGVTGRGG